MHGTRSKASSLASVIDVKVAKTNTSFLTSETLGTCLSNISFCYGCNM